MVLVHRRFLSCLLLAAAMSTLTGCATSSNDAVALYRQAGQFYEVVLTGRRVNMAHDPFHALFPGTHSSRFVLRVPRLQGTVQGSELPVEAGRYRFSGQISFANGGMTVDLYAENTDDRRRDPSSWNGHYVLRQQPQ